MADELLRDCFESASLRNPEKTAITFKRKDRVETEISYLDLNHGAHGLANLYLDLGVKQGDRILFSIEKSIFLVVAHIAAQKIGAVGVPLNPGFKKAEMVHILGDAEATLAVAGPAQEALIKEIDPGLRILSVDPQVPYQNLSFFRSSPDRAAGALISPEKPGLMIYTSGTTGKPKGAILTQRNLVHDALNIIRAWEITESDVLCHALPLFHVHGLCFALHTALIAGSHVFLLDAFSPESVLRTLSNKEGKYRCTLFMAVPSMYARMLELCAQKPSDFDHIRLWASGSAPLPVKHFQRIATAFGKEPVEREGMTETGMNFSNPLRGKRKAGSIGLPLPDLDVRIVNPETGQDVLPGETGEIWLKSPSISPGYWRKPEETAKAFEQGWFRTGDLGRVDEEGYYYLSDRLKHIIISGGENISPTEVEAVINSYDGVIESSVVGVPDEQWGEKVVAAVVLKAGAKVTPEELQAHCKEHLHRWKCPKEIALVGALPRNTMGKILKEEVKNLFSCPSAPFPP